MSMKVLELQADWIVTEDTYRRAQTFVATAAMKVAKEMADECEFDFVSRKRNDVARDDENEVARELASRMMLRVAQDFSKARMYPEEQTPFSIPVEYFVH